MTVKKVSQVGNPVIRAKAKPHADPSLKEAHKIVKNLIDSMRHHGLVGIAAPQIGKGVRIFVSEIRKTKLRKASQLDPLKVFINPQVLLASKKQEKDWEGCGSVAASGLFGKVTRAHSVKVRAQDSDGKTFTFEASGLLARIIQHEMDHLNGKVFTDMADPSTYMSRNEYLKMRKARAQS